MGDNARLRIVAESNLHQYVSEDGDNIILFRSIGLEPVDLDKQWNDARGNHELMSEGLEPMFVRINPAPAALPGRSNCVQVHDRAIDALTALASRLGIPVVE